ncbi:MAG: Ubiquinone/menaquinone biosynthesis C-methylase UbiE [Chloroflexi bacterium]|nr:MAG: Ubiquinone/menaquinone biosynthesis C-methylase UbiE [Chloroflexota bacterium]
MAEDHAGQSIPYPPHFFKRQDEGDDEQFYDQPRLVVHIDDHAIAAIGAYFQRALPQGGVLLDLMSSWRSHLPEGFPKAKLVGLGLNAVELAENPQLDERVVHNVNTNPALSLDDASFDAAMVTVSIQYMTKPVELFSEVGRVLKPGAAFHVIYSNRMFPTKAILAWQAADDDQRAQLIGSYFQNSGGWETPELEDVSPALGFPTDPVYVVTARRVQE